MAVHLPLLRYIVYMSSAKTRQRSRKRTGRCYSLMHLHDDRLPAVFSRKIRSHAERVPGFGSPNRQAQMSKILRICPACQVANGMSCRDRRLKRKNSPSRFPSLDGLSCLSCSGADFACLAVPGMSHINPAYTVRSAVPAGPGGFPRSCTRCRWHP